MSRINGMTVLPQDDCGTKTTTPLDLTIWVIFLNEGDGVANGFNLEGFWGGGELIIILVGLEHAHVCIYVWSSHI